MAYKFDKPYINLILTDQNKIDSILSICDELDTQQILQYSQINKLHLAVVMDRSGNNLIHLGILNINYKSEFAILNYVKFLVQQQVNPDQPNKENQTPLHFACQKQYKTVVEFLVSQNVNVNYQDNFGLTPFHYLLTGDITVYEEKQIKEFIAPKSNTTNFKVDKDALLTIKKDLWSLLNGSTNVPTFKSFFDTLQNTIKDTINNNDDIKKEIANLKLKLSEIPTINDVKQTTVLYLNCVKELNDLITKKWGKFSNSDDIVLHDAETNSFKINNDIGIIKDANVKQRIKNKLEEIITDITNIITNYKEYNEPTMDINVELSNDLMSVIDNHIKPIDNDDNITYPHPPFPLENNIIGGNLLGGAKKKINNNIFELDNKNIIHELTKKYEELKDENAYDFADNIIDLENLSFIGGSRQIIIIDDEYDDLKIKLNTLNSINKKVIYILLVYYDYMYNYNIIDEINKLNNNNYKLIFTNLKTLITSKSTITVSLQNQYNDIINMCQEIYEDIFINNIYNVGPVIYCKYVSTLLKYEIDNNLNLFSKLHKLFYRLVSALNNDPKNLNESLNYVFKIDDFYSIIKSNNRLNKWIYYLFADTSNNITVINNENTINQFIKDTLKLGEDKKKNTQLILDYYNSMTYKFPKLYLLDLIYYILNPDMLKKILADNDTKHIDLFMENERQSNKKLDNQTKIFNHITNQYSPSFNGYINVLFDDNNFNKFYLQYKFKESILLGLLFDGCLPNLIVPLNVSNNKLFTIDNNTFIFNPINAGSSLQEPTNFTPLPFNYCYSNSNIFDKEKYFYYIEDQYRPPYIESKQLLFINQYNQYNVILKAILLEYNNILSNLLSKKQKISSIYYTLFIRLKLIINKQKLLLNKITYKDQIEIFDFENFTDNLNNLNANIFLYYYLYKQSRKIPEFIYYKLNTDKLISDKYKLYNSTNKKTDLIGGALNLSNLNFMSEFYFDLTDISNNSFKIETILPPSLEDNLDNFYQLNKIKFINDSLSNKEEISGIVSQVKQYDKLNITDDEITDFKYFNIAKLIEEIIKNYAEYLINININNLLSTSTTLTTPTTQQPIYELINKEFQISTVLNNTVNDLTTNYDFIKDTKYLHNFYNFSDPNINKPCKFIIYPNDYTNTNILQQQYCIKIVSDIIKILLNAKAQPLLLDNNNNSCIESILSNFNFNILKDCIDNDIYFDKIEFVKNELINHTHKMFNNTYIETFENFTKPQYEEIKLLILSDESNGNNVLFNLKNSFNICFYIMNEYLTDYLWRFDSDYSETDFNDIINFLGFDKNNIKNNYVTIVANNNKNKLYATNTDLIMNEFRELYKKEEENLTKYLERLTEENKKYESLKINTNIVKNRKQNIKKITNDIKSINEKIINIKTNNYVNTYTYKKQIIETYEKILNNKDNGIYSSIWKLLLEDETLLNKSFNLSLLKILNNQLINPDNKLINKYFDHISKPAYLYFESPKFTNRKNNKVMCFIYELLVHLTKTQLCFGIEIIVRKIIYNNIVNTYVGLDIKDLNTIIDRIFTTNVIYKDNENSFLDVLYNILPEKFVKNSILIFNDLEEKVNFESQTILELLQNLFSIFKLIPEINTNEELFNNLNKNVANYFDLFIGRTIKNWYVVCENILKFVINQHRITNTLNILNDKINCCLKCGGSLVCCSNCKVI